jgi:predicted ATP-dependent serine protease
LFVPLGELLARSPARELEYVPLLGTDGLIARGTITLIGAHPKAGKTTLLVHACREWVQQNLRVVYLTEDPRIIWEERVKRFPELNRMLLNDFTRVHPEHWVRELRKLEPDVVVVDTIRRFVPTKDENDSASVSVALAPLVDLVHHLPRTAIVLVHHTKKNLSADGEITDIAGSHAYTAEVDAIFLLAPVRENKFQRILTPVAGRFWNFTPEPLVLELSETGTEYRVMGTVAEVLPLTQAQSAKQKVLNAIQVLGSATVDEVAEYLQAQNEHIPKRTIQHHLAQLYTDGVIQRDGRGTRSEPYIYSAINSCNRAIAQPTTTLHDCTNPSNPALNLFALGGETPDSGNENSRNRAIAQHSMVLRDCTNNPTTPQVVNG